MEAKAFKDERGFFQELFKKSDYERMGIKVRFLQDNHSRSVKGTLRGLHYQLKPRAQAKLVFAARGEIFDVVVDIRKGSPTYGRWVGETLSDENYHALFAPEGFAHGFCVMSSEADVIYKVSKEYSPDHERGITWNDQAIGIKWPIKRPTLSKRDSSLPTLAEASNNFGYYKHLRSGKRL